MKKHFIAMILASLLASPAAFAGGTYGGLSLGQVDISDFSIETGNLGIVLGDINDAGFGFEFFYSITIVDDSASSGGVDQSFETDTLGLFAVFQSPGDVYFKAKAGYGIVNLKWDIDFGDNELVSLNDTSEGFSYGLSIGTMIGDGALELTYYRFADLENVFGLEEAAEDGLASVGIEDADVTVDSDVEMINLSYVWTF